MKMNNEKLIGFLNNPKFQKPFVKLINNAVMEKYTSDYLNCNHVNFHILPEPLKGSLLSSWIKYSDSGGLMNKNQYIRCYIFSSTRHSRVYKKDVWCLAKTFITLSYNYIKDIVEFGYLLKDVKLFLKCVEYMNLGCTILQNTKCYEKHVYGKYICTGVNVDHINKYSDLPYKIPTNYEPIDWYISKSMSGFGGGYKDDNIGLTIQNSNVNTKLSVTNDFIDAINYLQKIPLTVRHDFYDDIIRQCESMSDSITDIKIYKHKVCSLAVMSILSGKPFYVPVRADFRGRIYGQGDMNPMFNKDIRNNLRFCDDIESETIVLDVSASVLQVAAMITWDKNLCKITNLLPSSMENDPYIDIVGTITQDTMVYRTIRISDNMSYNTIKNSEPFKIKDLNFNINESEFIFKYINNRSLIKRFIMTYIYGSNVSSISKSLCFDMNVKPSERFLMQWVVCVLSDILNERLSGAINILGIIKKLVLNGNIIPKFTLKSKTVDFSYYDSKNICMQIYDVKHKVSFVNIQKYSSINTSRGSVAHLFHSIDSEIVINMLNRCKRDNIPFYPIHDAFVIKNKDKSSILHNYAKSVLDIMNTDIKDILNCSDSDNNSIENVSALIKENKDKWNDYDLSVLCKSNNMLKVEK